MLGIPMGPARKPAEPLTDSQRKKLKETLIQVGLL